jgi:hypothetical protein
MDELKEALGDDRSDEKVTDEQLQKTLIEFVGSFDSSESIDQISDELLLQKLPQLKQKLALLL